MANVTFQQFQELDIRIGTIIKAEIPPWSHWVMKLTVEFGPSFAEASEGKSQRIIFAGLLHFYKPDDLEGKQFPFVVNLEPKKIGPEGDYSQGMMLCPSVAVGEGGMAEDEKPVLFTLLEPVPNGTKVR